MYTKAFFDEPFDRRGTASVKWDVMAETQSRETNPMWIADMDFRCPKEIPEALMKRAAHAAYGYTEQTKAATQAMLDFMQRRHGVRLKEQDQILMPCVVTGLRAAVLSLTEPGDRVIVQPPVYGPFYASVADNGRQAAECPLKHREDGFYQMDLDAVEQACREGAKLMLLCNPHNPVGRAWTKEELTALLDVLNRYQVPLVSDEIHEDFVYEKNGFVPVLTLATGEDAQVLSLTSASKTFNLAGLQQAVAMSRNHELLHRVEKTMQNAGVVQGNIFGLIATEAAYLYGDQWLDTLLDYIKEGEGILRARLKELLPKAVISPLQATYLAWVDLRAYGFTTEQLMERCRAQGVEFTPGTFFGQAGDGFLRVNLACPHQRVMDAAERLAKAVLA